MKHEFRKLQIWNDARTLNKMIYTSSASFPREEKYGLTSQIRRASVSIASNISEGSSGQSNKMFLKYLYISLGSLCEVETQLYLAFDIKYIEENELKLIIKETDVLKRKIIGFMNSLEKNKI